MSQDRRPPAAFRLDGDRAGPEPPKRPAGRKPTSMAAPQIRIEPDEPDAPLAATRPEPVRVTRAMHWGSLLVTAIAGLVTLWAGLAMVRLVEELFARSALLGWIGAGFMALAGLLALLVIGREVAGLVRLARLGTVREDAAQALLKADAEAAKATIAALKRIYHGRRDVAWALQRLKEHEAEIMDPADRVRLAELDLMAPLDQLAGRLIAVRSRRVMLLTAITPAAILDVLIVAVQNMKMLREVATVYGGRPGLVGTMRLARMVIAHLAAAGALAMSDQMVQQVVGQGILGRLSARFGEGAVNGILTARIGLATIDVCRPLPFTATSRPGLAQFLADVVRMAETEKARS